MMLLVFGSSEVSAQNNVQGQVTSSTDGSPVFGATVVVTETNRGTITDDKGNFTIAANPGQTITVSFMGYMSSNTVVAKGVTNLKIKLIEDTKMIDDVVVVGYGEMRKKEVTGSVARVDSDDLSRMGSSDVTNALQGLVAGVNVQSSSGQPGETSNIQIRGLNSIDGDNTPLYVVDGVPYEGDPGLSDNEIESIDILKDAASAAVYGTRGAGGVILITTKSGKAGSTKVSFTGYYGIQNITSGIELMEAADYMYVELLRQYVINGNTSDYAATTLQNYPKGFLNNTDLLSVVINDNAPIQNYTINISGGTKEMTFSIAGGYFNQEGVLINSEFERYNMRINTTFKKYNWEVSANTSIRIEEQLSPIGTLLLKAYSYAPTSVYVHPDMSTTNTGDDNESSSTSVGNTLSFLKQTSTKHLNNLSANLQVAYKFPYDIKLSSRLGTNYVNTQTTMLKPLFELYDSNGDLKSTTTMRSTMRETYALNTSLTWENVLDWSKKIDKHSIKATGVFGVEQYTYKTYYAEVKDLTSNDVTNLNAGTADMLVGTASTDRTTTLVGMMLRGQYSYDDRYMFTASIRRDGSSRFSEENRWGYFPSVSGGWNVSEEEFWKPMSKIVNNFKVRVSYGTTGNQNFSDYLYSQAMTSQLDYAYGDNVVTGTAMTTFSNADVKWETTSQINLGVDFGLFKNKLTTSIDVYESNKSDMLFPLLISPSAGAGSSSTVTYNVGNMQNRGVEFAIGYRNKIKKLGYRVNMTVTKNVNEMTDMGGVNDMYYFSSGSPIGVTTGDLVTAVKVGYPAGSFFTMPTNGVINTEEELVAYQKLNASASMGDLKYVDADGNGVIDDGDRVYSGNGAPDVELGLNLGLNWKNFDFNMDWYFSLGNEVINGSKITAYQQKTHQDLVYQWSYANPDSTIPTYRTSSHDNYRAYADIWVEDGTFARLKNLSLGYTIPNKLMKKAKITKFRVYVAADNLVTITAYEGYDPEVGGSSLATRGLDQGKYPVSRQFRAGAQLSF